MKNTFKLILLLVLAFAGDVLVASQAPYDNVFLKRDDAKISAFFAQHYADKQQGGSHENDDAGDGVFRQGLKMTSNDAQVTTDHVTSPECKAQEILGKAKDLIATMDELPTGRGRASLASSQKRPSVTRSASPKTSVMQRLLFEQESTSTHTSSVLRALDLDKAASTWSVLYQFPPKVSVPPATHSDDKKENPVTPKDSTPQVTELSTSSQPTTTLVAPEVRPNVDQVATQSDTKKDQTWNEFIKQHSSQIAVCVAAALGVAVPVALALLKVKLNHLFMSLNKLNRANVREDKIANNIKRARWIGGTFSVASLAALIAALYYSGNSDNVQ